jgi:hypothetical protein
MITLTVTVGPQTNKARALHVGRHQGQRAVVSILTKTDWRECLNTRTSLDFNASGLRTHQSWQVLLSLRSLGRARHGADNERSRH